jgi:poly(glycerol-phosphate) alpha-glucosyltransferase
MQKVKITCLTESISKLGGGLFDAERRIQQSVVAAREYVDIQIVGMPDTRSQQDMALWSPINATTLQTSKFPPGLGYSRQFEKTLLDSCPDVVYSIGLWKYFSRACLKWHLKTNGPYIVAPHGMLDPWALQNHKIRKAVLMRLYQRSHLENAACIRALNTAEFAAIRQLKLKNPVCIIPNGVDLPQIAEPVPSAAEPLTVLFLGRLHPKKGIEQLLKAWKQFVTQTSQPVLLKIVGWGDEPYTKLLQQSVEEDRLEATVTFTGPLFGDEKQAAFRGASAFILPSFSEGMPMTVLEAWSYRLPVIMTPHCNIPEGKIHEASIECQPSAASILDALNRFGEMSLEERRLMGRNGRLLVERQFTWEKVSHDLAKVYDWLAKTADWPDCVTREL